MGAMSLANVGVAAGAWALAGPAAAASIPTASTTRWFRRVRWTVASLMTDSFYGLNAYLLTRRRHVHVHVRIRPAALKCRRHDRTGPPGVVPGQHSQRVVARCAERR